MPPIAPKIYVQHGGPCVVCGQQVHAPTCPIVTLRNEVLELLSHLGIFVSNIRDTVDTIDRILTDRE